LDVHFRAAGLRVAGLCFRECGATVTAIHHGVGVDSACPLPSTSTARGGALAPRRPLVDCTSDRARGSVACKTLGKHGARFATCAARGSNLPCAQLRANTAGLGTRAPFTPVRYLAVLRTDALVTVRVVGQIWTLISAVAGMICDSSAPPPDATSAAL
jgi:hypothetical protein